LNNEQTNEMSDQPPSRVTARRRRANTSAPRQKSVHVRLTEREHEQLAGLADGHGVSVQRLLVEAALAGRETPAARRSAMVELFAIRRLLANVANNVNQLARAANVTGDTPAVARLEAVLEELRGVLGRTLDALDGLGGRV